MPLLDPPTKGMLRHAAQSFILVVAMTVAAVVLDVLEHYLASFQISPWLVTCVGLVSKILYAVDVSVLLGIAGLTAAHSLRRFYRYLFREPHE
jgi:undecaprenyl pyrophosphate phosphatase UppP